MVGVLEVARRGRGILTHEIGTLPILALHVHTACNCRCVMCDIWKANADRREISAQELSSHIDAIARLHVKRVMLTGGEPLLHSNLWALCDRLRALEIDITLVTTGLLIDHHAHQVAQYVDTLVISLDGPREVHDAIRRVKGGFDRIAKGITALRGERRTPRLIARSVVQKQNYACLRYTVAAARTMGFDEISFLAADVSSPAFNRPDPWPPDRQAEIALQRDDLDRLAAAIEELKREEGTESGFVAGGAASLDRIRAYYRALNGVGSWPAVRCNAPWVSAVLEPDGTLRPCFFHAPYGVVAESLTDVLNSPDAVAFRRGLRVEQNTTCQRCVCSLNLPLFGSA